MIKGKPEYGFMPLFYFFPSFVYNVIFVGKCIVVLDLGLLEAAVGKALGR